MERGFKRRSSTAIVPLVTITLTLMLAVSLQACLAATTTSRHLPRQTGAAGDSPALRLIARAEKANNAGKRSEARAILKPLLAASQPPFVLAQAYYVLGEIAMAENERDPEVARSYFLQAASIYPNSDLAALARIEAARALIIRRDYAGIIAECQPIVTKHSASREIRAYALFRIGEMLYMQNRPGEAVAYWRQLLRDFAGTHWAETTQERLAPIVANMTGKGMSMGPFTSNVGLAPPQAKIWASTDGGKTWRADPLHVVVGVQVLFKARTPENGDLPDHDCDDVNGDPVDQWNNSVKCLWDFSGGTGFSADRILNVSEMAAKTFTIPGRYTIRLRTDDIEYGTAADDPPMPAVNELVVIVGKGK